MEVGEGGAVHRAVHVGDGLEFDVELAWRGSGAITIGRLSLTSPWRLTCDGQDVATSSITHGRLGASIDGPRLTFVCPEGPKRSFRLHVQ